MTPIYQWAQRHNISAVALTDLLGVMGATCPPAPPSDADTGEQAVQQQRVLRAAQQGGRMWRNNSGACEAADGRQIRYGLGNVSVQVNKVMKSSDLIGITSTMVTPAMVGSRVGIFTAEEIKHPDWKFRESDDRAVAQFNFLKLVISLGGIGRFVNRGDL
jgi:hypothetical protein